MPLQRDQILREPKLAAYATSALPAWLWRADGPQILWANAVAAAIFGADTIDEIAGRQFEPDHLAAAQVAKLADTLPAESAPRLERLRGFGPGFGRLLTCACMHLTLKNSAGETVDAILVAAVEPAGPVLSVSERIRRLLGDENDPTAAFSPQGDLVYATPAALAVLGQRDNLTALKINSFAEAALAVGHAKGMSSVGDVVCRRIGVDAATLILATFSIAAEKMETKAAIEAPTMTVDAPLPEANETIPERRYPLRFVWQMDAEGRFSLGSDEFSDVIGPGIAVALGRPWNEIAAALDLDPQGHVARAVATRDTWSGIVLSWPAEGSPDRLPVELSGLPIFDRDRVFRGYRGFGVCRDLARIAQLRTQRLAMKAALARLPDTPPALVSNNLAQVSSSAAAAEQRPNLSLVPQAPNVLPFPSSADNKIATLSTVERNAFAELAQRLSARLKGDEDARTLPSADDAKVAEDISQPPEGQIAKSAIENSASFQNERTLLDRLPIGVLIYRHEHFIYSNRAFLEWIGHDDLKSFAEAGGLDTLFIEDSKDAAAFESMGQSLLIETPNGDKRPTAAKLLTIPWDDATAMALVLGDNGAAIAGSPKEKAEVQELKSILDIATDGILLIDAQGQILNANRGARALFAQEGDDLSGRVFTELLGPESARAARQYLENMVRLGGEIARNEGREVMGRTPTNGKANELTPLYLTIGRVAAESEKFCAVFRDVAPWKKVEEDLIRAKRQAEKASSAKSDFIAKISHEIRTPLNAIIGFSEVMMDERFGTIGNERYREYLKDIHASGGHLLSLLNDLLDLSKIEAGKLDLNFANIDLNDLTQQSVALMQPQANRERVIIRTSLGTQLPPVVADARAVRQMVLNLLSNSIKFTAAGGQVIVSTALTDTGDVVLRVRDTGIGMNEKDIAIALEPFRQLTTSSRSDTQGTGLGLPLTKALAEANRARFAINSAANAGTLVEIAFPAARVLAAE